MKITSTIGAELAEDGLDVRIRHLLDWLANAANEQQLREEDKIPVLQFLKTTSAAYQQLRKDRDAARTARKAAFWDALIADFDASVYGEDEPLITLLERYNGGLPPVRQD